MMNARLEELRAKFQENPRRYFAPFANELRKAGDSAQAIAVCRTHLAGQQGHVSGHIVLGQALFEAGEAREARDVFTTALELDPENLIALRSLGEIAQINGEFGMARQWYERLLDADPRNTEVSQLLKDIPSAAEGRSFSAPVAEAAATVPEALPDGATFEPPPSPPSVHTGFTGQGPAYKSAEPDDEPIEEPVETQSSDFEPPADVEGVESEPPTEQSVPVAAESATEVIDTIDFDSFLPPTPAAKSLDDYDGPSAVKPPSAFDLDLEITTPGSEKEEAEVRENGAAAEADIDIHDEAASSPTDASPRAQFAELGFEGPANDQGGTTTPSAALSDLESAPENWFDEVEAARAEETRAEETAAAEITAAAQPDDSWFDEAEGATAVESTEASAEEFWLPPELPQIWSDEAAPAGAPDLGIRDEAPVLANAGETADDDAVVMASAETDSEQIETEDFGLAGIADGLDDTVMSESSAEVSATYDDEPVEPEPVHAEQWAPPAEPEPVHAEQWAPPAEPEPVHAEQWEQPDEPEPVEAQWTETAAPEPAQSAHWSEPAEPQPVQAEQWTEPVESESVEAAHASDGDFGADGFDFATDLSAKERSLAENVIGHTPSFIDAVSPPPAPFVTETLAELYLQQGFREEALAIYRQLVERDPANEELRLRVQAIEQGAASEGAQSTNVPIEERAGSQSVRTFFSRLARRGAVTGPSSPTPSGTSGSEPEVPFAAAASALANLFSASKPPASDEGAAATLAGAFTDPAGRPSRAADRELSLDHLFRDVPPGGPANAGVSLDEFYATPNAPPGSPTEPGDAAGPTEPGGTDIRQFTAWLEGLRKK